VILLTLRSENADMMFLYRSDISGNLLQRRRRSVIMAGGDVALVKNNGVARLMFP